MKWETGLIGAHDPGNHFLRLLTMGNYHKWKRDEAPVIPPAAANGGGEIDFSLLEVVEKS